MFQRPWCDARKILVCFNVVNPYTLPCLPSVTVHTDRSVVQSEQKDLLVSFISTLLIFVI